MAAVADLVLARPPCGKHPPCPAPMSSQGAPPPTTNVHTPEPADVLRRLVQAFAHDVRPLGLTLRELVLSSGTVDVAPPQVVIYEPPRGPPHPPTLLPPHPPAHALPHPATHAATHALNANGKRPREDVYAIPAEPHASTGAPPPHANAGALPQAPMAVVSAVAPPPPGAVHAPVAPPPPVAPYAAMPPPPPPGHVYHPAYYATPYYHQPMPPHATDMRAYQQQRKF